MYDFNVGFLYSTRTDITPNSPGYFGVLQDITIDLELGLKELYGQWKFPVDQAQGKGKITGKAKTATINGKMLNELIFGQTLGTTQTLGANLIAGTIPSNPGPYTLTPTVPNSGTWATDRGVVKATTGVPFQVVASGPTAGQYSVAAGVYTFAAADAGALVSISFDYTLATTGSTIALTNPLAGTPQTVFAVSLNNTYNGKAIWMLLYACVSSKLALNFKLDDYLIPEFDFSAQQDASGSQNVFKISVSE